MAAQGARQISVPLRTPCSPHMGASEERRRAQLFVLIRRGAGDISGENAAEMGGTRWALEVSIQFWHLQASTALVTVSQVFLGQVQFNQKDGCTAGGPLQLTLTS